MDFSIIIRRRKWSWGILVRNLSGCVVRGDVTCHNTGEGDVREGENWLPTNENHEEVHVYEEQNTSVSNQFNLERVSLVPIKISPVVARLLHLLPTNPISKIRPDTSFAHFEYNGTA
ncbi:hypothetical protein CEXT_356991 [Caerostris extrusa]|uniref:Uncharacterized protein n=1 Tax=Caerostris extrusa TaxID=172846 RepID=A0AAV4RA02_CAEEX|nr:hypothetical protein CEXT_356991 [Caerostris extrusa]